MLSKNSNQDDNFKKGTLLKTGEAKEKIKDLISVLESEESPGLFLWGPPGIGKSAIIRQIADELELEFIDLRLSLLDPIDLRGLPLIDQANNQAKWLPPDFLPSPTSKPGILFLDELNAAVPMVQASAYQLILNKRIGNYKLPKGWMIIAAGNREIDRAITYSMPTPLANRFIHLDLECDIDDWKEWAYNSGVSEIVIGFLSYKPDYLFQFNPTQETRTFPTPRSWDFVSKIIQNKDCIPAMFYYISGLVGQSIATEFISFYKLFEQIPKMELILNGLSLEVPKNLSVLYLLITGLVSEYKRTLNKTYQKNLLKYLNVLPVEFSVLLAKDLVKVDSTITLNKDFVAWTSKNKEILIDV